MIRPVQLYHYWRSSSSWRVRLALAVKKIDVKFVHVGLLDGEAESPEHRARNPLGYVPVLELETAGGREYLFESLAIMEWLEENSPGPGLLPKDPILRAKARSLAEIINSEIQPLQNLTVLSHVSEDAEIKKRWAQHWISKGLSAFETTVKKTAGDFSVGNQISIADLCIIPQCYSALRFEVNLGDYPETYRIYQKFQALQIFESTHPDRFKPEGFQGP